MNLKSLLILLFIILTYGQRNFDLYGYVKRYTNETFYSSGYCVYFDNNEFTDVEEIEINVTVYNGRFTEEDMYYGKSDEIFKKGESLRIPVIKTYTSYIAGEYYNYSDKYREFTFIFNIPKLNQRYL